MTQIQRRIVAHGALIAIAVTCCASLPASAEDPSPYLGQPVPGQAPELFAPGIVSLPDAVELNAVFSPDMTEFYFARLLDGIQTLHLSVLEDGAWGEPQPLRLFPGDQAGSADDMSVSTDGREMFFLGVHPLVDGKRTRSPDIWKTTRREGEWTTATLVPPPISTDAAEIYPVVVADGSLYFASNRGGSIGRQDIWRAQRLPDGTFAEPVNVGPPINGPAGSGDTYVAPDESFMVQSSRRPGGFGSSDLWVFFRQDDGAWGEPKNLGGRINTAGIEYCPMMTPDQKYLFFSTRLSDPPDSGWAGVIAGDVFWVDASVVFELRE